LCRYTVGYNNYQQQQHPPPQQQQQQQYHHQQHQQQQQQGSPGGGYPGQPGGGYQQQQSPPNYSFGGGGGGGGGRGGGGPPNGFGTGNGYNDGGGGGGYNERGGGGHGHGQPYDDRGGGGGGGSYGEERRPERAPVPMPTAPPFTAFVGNFPYECSMDDVVGLFSANGCAVTDVRMVRNRDTDRPRGYFIEFEDVPSLERCLGFDQYDMGGRPLRVNVAEVGLALPGVRLATWTIPAVSSTGALTAK
jgi:hypothetical protein